MGIGDKMTRKICPICDLPLGAFQYCPRCRRIVRHPYIVNADYYLNTSHPQEETDCEYHNPYLEADHHHDRQLDARTRKSTAETTRPVAGTTRPAAGTMGPVAGATRPVTGTMGPAAGVPRPAAGTMGPATGASRPAAGMAKPAMGTTRPDAGTARPVTGTMRPVTGTTRPVTGMMGRQTVNREAARNVFLTIIVLAIFLIVVSIAAGDRDDSPLSMESEEYIDMGADEVKEAGIPCNTIVHFPAQASVVMDDLWSYIDGHSFGYVTTPEDIYTDNYIYRVEGRPDMFYYETTEGLHMRQEKPSDGDSDAYEYIDISYDTVNGEMHSYTSALQDKEASIDYMRQFFTLTEEACGLDPIDRRGESLAGQGAELIRQGQDGYLAEGLFEVDIYHFGDTVHIYIYGVDLSAVEADEL